VITPLIYQFGASASAPLAPEATLSIGDMTAGQIWSRYVRTIGAGAVAAAGIVTVAKMFPTMAKSFLAVARGVGGGGGTRGAAPNGGAETARTERDVPPVVVIAGIATVVLALVFVPGIFGGSLGLGGRAVAALAVTVFGILFVGVSSRIVGLIGVSSNPTSGMALVTILGTSAVFVALGWTSEPYRATVITVAAVVCVAASKAGDISQDLKTGHLVGATPYRQQFGQLLGASVACWAVAGTVLVLGHEWGFGSKELPAPQATLMKTIVEGVLAGTLSWGFVTTGAALALTAMLAGLPGLSFAIGLYLPLASMAPIFLGGLVRRIVDARRGGPASEALGGDPGILCASGLIAGEGLAGVAIAGYLAIAGGRAERTPLVGGGGGAALSIAIALLGLFLLYRAGASGKKA
jgi:putative OPT family oligopeptide transporter